MPTPKRSPIYVFHNAKFDIRALASIGIEWGAYTHIKPQQPRQLHPQHPRIAVDTETTGLDFYHGCRPFYVSSCTDQGLIRCWEFDVDPLTREVVYPKEKLATLQRFLSGADWNRIDDTIIGSHVIASAESHRLKDLAAKYLDIPKTDQQELKIAVAECRKLAKKKGWRIAKEGDPCFPAANTPTDGWWVYDTWLPRAIAKHDKYPTNHRFWTVLATYATQDAERTIALWAMIEEALSEESLWLQYNFRKQQLPITYRSDSHGLTVKPGKIATIKPRFQELAAAAQEHCQLATGIKNLASPKQLQESLFIDLKLKPVRATKTGYSTDADTLNELTLQCKPGSKPFQFIESLIDARKYTKAIEYLQTYELGGHPHKIPGFTTIYPSSNITGTKTTRYSYSNPNLQQVSKQEKTNLRSIFCPLPGREWWSLDYDNQELRIFAYASGDKLLIKAFEDGYSVHLIFAEILHPELFKQCERDGVSFKDRYKATWYQWLKNGTFALIYGAAPRKANATYRVSDGYERIRKRMPLIDKFIATKSKEAKQYGYITTIGGYRLQVPLDEPYKASNYYIQGSAGEAIQLAMLRIAAYLDTLSDEFKFLLNVHDELIFDFPRTRVPNNDKIAVIQRLMEQSGEDFSIPFPVSVDRIRESWAQELAVAV